MNDGTFAADARSGVYYELTCQSCGRRLRRTAQSLVDGGWGHLQVVGSQGRFRCTACGYRGAHLFLYGWWRGVGPQPEGWAATAEARMRGEGPPDQ